MHRIAGNFRGVRISLISSKLSKHYILKYTTFCCPGNEILVLYQRSTWSQYNPRQRFSISRYCSLCIPYLGSHLPMHIFPTVFYVYIETEVMNQLQ